MDSSGIGAFTSTMIGLSPNTTYYMRAYATTIYGTKYGNEISFRSKNQFQGPWVRLGEEFIAPSSIEQGPWTELSSDGNTMIIGWITYGPNWEYKKLRVYSFKNGTWERKGSDFLETNISAASLSGNGMRICIAYDMQPTRRKVLQWNGTSWTQVGGNIDGKNGEGFPEQIEMSNDGNTFIEVQHDPSGNSEIARIYTYNGTAWIPKGKDLIPTAFYGYFAESISISDDGNIIALGSPGWSNNSATYGVGRVDIYKWNGTQWNVHGNLLRGSNNGEEFGITIALSGNGNAILINSSNEPSYTGFVQYYRYNGSAWQKLGSTLSGSSLEEFGFLGLSISTTGTRFAIGSASALGGKGRVQVFDVEGTNIVKKGQEFYGSSLGAHLGYYVSISGDGNRLALGESYPNENPVPPFQRNVKVYQW
jgi:hypothetical protein